MKDLYHDLLPEHSIYPFIQTAAKTGDAIIDLAGFEGALIICYVGDITADTTFQLMHGDEPALGDAAAVPDADLVGTEPTFEFATDDNTVLSFAYVGTKRYLRVDTTVGAGTAGAIIVKGHARHAPVV